MIMAFNKVRKIDNLVEINNVLVSVYNKSHLEVIINALCKANPQVRLFATGNSFAFLKDHLPTDQSSQIVAISDYTGQPEMQGGVVKTLDYKIYLGLLAETYNPSHQNDLRLNKAVAFDMVICNLYPFDDVISKNDISFEEARAYIDIGGPTMIRAAAKNFHRVAVVCDYKDYQHLAELIIHSSGKIDLTTRFTLARKAFYYIMQYDIAIANYLLEFGAEKLKKYYEII